MLIGMLEQCVRQYNNIRLHTGCVKKHVYIHNIGDEEYTNLRLTVMALVGSIETFNVDHDNWLENVRVAHTTCSKCKKKGYLANVCKGTGMASYSQHPNKTNLVRPVDEQAETLTHSCRYCSDVNLITAEDEIELIHTIRGADPYKILLDVNGEVIDFEIDTGARRTILPAKVYREKSSHIPLERTNDFKNLLGGKIEGNWKGVGENYSRGKRN